MLAAKNFLFVYRAHHAEGQFNPNLMNKKTVTAFRYLRACRFRKYEI
jgi:hypothetical protein